MGKRFRVGFSFAGEKRAFVAEVAEILAQQFGFARILYDKFHEAEFANADLAFDLPSLYEKETDLVVGIICKSYNFKEWTGLEWKSIYGLIKQKKINAVLLSRFDHAEPEGLFGLAGYIELDAKTAEEFADLIRERLAINEGKPIDFYKNSKTAIFSAADPMRPTRTNSTKDDKDLVLKQFIQHNLPQRLHHKFIGRQEDLKELRRKLSFNEYLERIITITGIGGVGKTTLALEAAYTYIDISVEDNMFDLVVFASAQKKSLAPTGVITLADSSSITTLVDLCRNIAKVSNQVSLKRMATADLVQELHKFLSTDNRKTLIILDNLEEIEDVNIREIRKFFKDIKSSTIKVLITTRQFDDPDLNLLHLPPEESIELINSLLAKKNLLLDEKFKNDFQIQSGGIPLAIVYSIGLLALKKEPRLVLQILKDPSGDLAVYCFEKIFHTIKNDFPESHKFLLVLSLTPHGFTRTVLFDVCNIEESQMNSAIDSLDQLRRCSLVYYDDGFYRQLPLTRSYVLGKLEKDSDLSREIHKGLVKSYVSIAQLYGGEDKGEWHRDYDEIDKEWGNFRCIFDTCLSEGDFENAKLLWQSLCRFTYLYAYWTDREIWTDRLIDLSKQRGDNCFLAELMTAKAWIAILRESDENLRNANELLKNASKISKDCSLYVQSTIALNLAVCYTRSGNFKKADFWFIQQHNKEFKDFRNRMTENQYKRLELRFLLYFAERFYRETNYVTAFKIYQQVVKKADKIDWLRFKVKAFERIAFLKIKNRQYDKAREILDTWYPVMERNHDIRRMAFFQRDYAELEFQLQNFNEARYWAAIAQKIFLDLGMVNRVSLMEKYLNSCNTAYLD